MLDAGIVVLGFAAVLLAWALFNRIGSPRPDPTRVYNPNGLLGDIIQVEVRNGCGIGGLASRMTDYLRSYGFDVVEHGDFSTFDVESTRVVDRIGNADAAKQVAIALGLTDADIVEEVRPDSYLDVSVIIGKDYRSLLPFQADEGARVDGGDGSSVDE